MIDDLITYLRDKTNLTRFSRGEIREVIERMNEDGWEIVRRDDGAIVEPVPDPFPPEPAFSPSEFNDRAREFMAEAATAREAGASEPA